MAGEGYESETARVGGIIRGQIIDGRRAPGSKLVERELAEELGVSRVPVREALRLLATEGLVVPRPRSWAIVREFSDDDVRDLNEVRAALEVLAFRLAALRHDEEGLDSLATVLRREQETAAAGDLHAARHAAADFHETVTHLAGNGVLDELGAVMSGRLRWLLSQHDDALEVAREHEALFEAIAARDTELLDQLVHAHMDTAEHLRGTVA